MNERKRLIELIVNVENEILQKYPYTTDTFRIAHVADYLLENGVVVPPCKVGDTVYLIDLFDYEPCKKNGKCGDVCPHLYAEYGVGYECRKGKYGAKPFSCAEIKTIEIKDICQIFDYWNQFGKTMFLTREEAEQELQKRQGESQ